MRRCEQGAHTERNAWQQMTINSLEMTRSWKVFFITHRPGVRVQHRTDFHFLCFAYQFLGSFESKRLRHDKSPQPCRPVCLRTQGCKKIEHSERETPRWSQGCASFIHLALIRRLSFGATQNLLLLHGRSYAAVESVFIVHTLLL